MSEITKHEAKCPYPGCDGVLKIRDDLPTGKYWCLCDACEVKLSWSVYLQGGRKPYLTLVEKTTESPENV